MQEEIEVDFTKKEIANAKGFGGNIDDFYAIEAVDQAELCFFILQRDATYVKHGSTAYIQAKMLSMDDDDDDSNGKGIAKTVVTLYNISEKFK